MNIYFITYKLIDKDIQKIDKMIEVLAAPTVHINIPNQKLKLTSPVTTICLGKVAFQFVKQYIEDKKLNDIVLYELPTLKQLSPCKENRIIREETFQKLKEIGNQAKQNIRHINSLSLKKDEIITLDEKQLLAGLIKQESVFFCRSNGEKIIISPENSLGNFPTEIVISYEELLMAKRIVETLTDIKEVSIRRK